MAIDIELLEERQENSKTFDISGGRRRLGVHIGAVHYKDNYVDAKEQWKDISLKWVGNRITTAPYELIHDDKKLTLRGKRTDEVTTIELLDTQPAGLNFEVIPEYTRVSFRHTIPSDKVPFEARFKITGKGYIKTKAWDDEGELELETSLVDGILTEKLSSVKDKQTGLIRPVKGNIRIDPTWQVGASTDDVYRRLGNGAWAVDAEYIVAGAAAAFKQYGGGMRFQNITVPKDATITTAYLTFTAYSDQSGTVANARISAEDVDDPATFADDSGIFDTRYGNHTTAVVDWDGIAAWTDEAEYNSPECKTIEQELVSRPGWQSGFDQVWFFEDYDDRSDANARRSGYSWDGNNAKAPKLVITYAAVMPVISMDYHLQGVR